MTIDRTKQYHRRVLPLMLAAATLFTGCAYFNTYYNGKRFYDQAGAARRSDFPDTVSASAAAAVTYQKAIDKFAAVIIKYPTSRYALTGLFNIGNAYYYRGEYEKAYRKYEEIWTYFPESKYTAPAHLNAALLSWKVGEYERAQINLTALENIDDRRILERAHYLAAQVAQSHQSLAEATVLWERFLFRHPKSGLANPGRYHYGQCLLATGQIDGAIRELETLSRRRLRRALRQQTAILLGEACEQAGQAVRALKIYNGLMGRQLDAVLTPTVELRIARIRAAGSEPAEALRLFAEVARKYPRTEASAEALFSMGEINERTQSPDSALAYYNRTRQEVTSGPLAQRALQKASNLALLMAYRKDANQQTKEQSAKLQYLMAEHFLFGLDQPDSALTIYQKVAEDFPDQVLAAKACYARGWTLERFKDDTAQAFQVFRDLIARYPRTRYANAAREELRLPLDLLAVEVEPDIEVKTPSKAAIDTIRMPPPPSAPGKPGGTVREKPQPGGEPGEEKEPSEGPMPAFPPDEGSGKIPGPGALEKDKDQ